MKVRLSDGSGTRDYRYIAEDVSRHGQIRVYFRAPGRRKMRLIEKPGTPEFDAEYMRALNGDRSGPSQVIRKPGAHAAPESMRWLCEQYYASATFQDLEPSTRRVRRRILDAICNHEVEGEHVGTFRFAEMEPRHVAKLRDGKVATPEAANSYVKALRRLFAWACLPEYGFAARNPARDVGYLAPKKAGGHRTWTEADVLKYEARHPIGTKARLALDLFLYSGVRISDVVKLGPQMERDDGKLIFTEAKGRARIIKTHELPILPPLRRSIDATPTGHLVYLVTEFGHPYSVKGFGNWFKRRCHDAGVDGELSAHGLRKLGAVRCAEGGATEHQLMALFGWTTTKQAGVYTRMVNRARLEAGAAPLLARISANDPEHSGNEIVPPSRIVASGGTTGREKP